MLKALKKVLNKMLQKIMNKLILALFFFMSSLGGVSDAVATSRSTWAGSIWLTSYYRINSNTNRYEACLTSPLTFFPLVIGCAPVAPPLEENVMPTTLLTYTENTRCQYLGQQRYDLKNLGNYIKTNELVASGKGNMYSAAGAFSPTYPVYDSENIIGFLKSDLHIVSTAIGCIQDMVVNMFTLPAAGSTNGQPFLGMVQSNMRSFIMAVLTLYVALVGIKIMTSGASLKRGEYMMFMFKFAFVLYINTVGFWVATASDPNSLNVFPSLIYGSDYLISMFTSALNANDPLGACSYIYNNTELLAEQTINLPEYASIQTTPNDLGVHLTIWDLIDCKIANYLNFGSCHYSGSGLISLLLVGLSASFGAYLLYAIVVMAYMYLLVTMILKFTRITILCSIILATLVIVSPLFSCFLLFDKTKSMFQDWFKALLGYMLYPAFLMAYFVLMFLSIDSLYYSGLDLVAAHNNATTAEYGDSARLNILKTACLNVDNIFCSTVTFIGDPCASNPADYVTKFSENSSLFSGQSSTFTQKMKKNMTKLGDAIMVKYLKPTVSMMLFSLLFYLLMDSSIKLISLITSIHGVDKVAETGLMSFIFSYITAAFTKGRG